MWYQVLIPSPLLIIPVLVMTTKCHTPKDNPDVIVISSKHAESIQNVAVAVKNNTQTLDVEKFDLESTTKNVFIIMNKATTLKEVNIVSSNEDVVFIPNAKEGVKKKTVEEYWNEEAEGDDKMTLHDLMNQGKKMSEIFDPKNIKIETEKPNEDVIFISGKNDDVIDKPEKKVEKKQPNDNTFKKHPQAKGNPFKLKCNNLDCNNNLQSLCGGKLENRQWRYRLFLNECYFRKVNCDFKKKENRYQEVPLYNCHGIASHSSEQFEFKPYQPKPLKSEESSSISKLLETRRILSSSRRSLTTGIDGRLCSHPCPMTCTEHYEPECAVSGTGHIRVFVNHCKMDWNSCSYGIVWHQRPLADCVGGKKADMRQNRGFINWMQSVGIVDNKGKLVLH